MRWSIFQQRYDDFVLPRFLRLRHDLVGSPLSIGQRVAS
jgi:hypothetical protein